MTGGAGLRRMQADAALGVRPPCDVRGSLRAPAPNGYAPGGAAVNLQRSGVSHQFVHELLAISSRTVARHSGIRRCPAFDLS